MKISSALIFKRFLFVIVTGLGILSTIPTIIYRYRINVNPFWDAQVYVKAVESVKLNLNPYFYDTSVPIYSVYPYHPYVLQAMVDLDQVLPIQFWLSFFYLIAILYFARELFYTYNDAKKDRVLIISSIQFGVFLILAGLIGGSSFIAIASGNISIFLHFFLISHSLRSIRLRKSLLGFSVNCAIAALVKPYFLAYLLIVLIYSSSKRRGLALTASSIFLWGLVYFSALYLSSSSFESYLNAVRYVTSGIQDWGFSFYGIFRRRLGDGFAVIAHLMILTPVILLPLYLRYRRNFNATQMLGFFPSIVFFLICLNPRMKEYDFGALIFISLSSIYLLNRSIAYLLILGCSAMLLIRILLLWLDANLVSSIPGNLLYLKYWEVIIAGSLMLSSTMINLIKNSSQSNA